MVTAKKAGAPARAAGAARPTDPRATKSGARGPASGPARGASRGATPSRAAHTATRKDGRPNPQRAGSERPPPVDLDGAFRLLKAVLERHVHSLQVLFNTPEKRPEPELVGALDALVRTAHARLRSAGLA
jgi:hypothetical protein